MAQKSKEREGREGRREGKKIALKVTSCDIELSLDFQRRSLNGKEAEIEINLLAIIFQFRSQNTFEKL